MKFEIEITKDIIDRSIMCGIGPKKGGSGISRSCAFALAYNTLGLKSSIGINFGYLYRENNDEEGYRVTLTPDQMVFVKQFDIMGEEDPNKRYNLVGRKFLVEIPDEFISELFQGEVELVEKLANSNCLKLIEEDATNI